MKTSALASLLALPDLENRLTAVEDALPRALRSDTAQLVGPGMRVVRGGGKRIRPVLTLAAAAAVLDAGPTKDIISGAVAVELVHVGSLVHDDIMDRATERRGVPTVNASEGTDHAILLGDYLLACAGIEAAKVSKEVAQVLAQAIADLCDGQSREIADLYNVKRTVDSYLDSIKGKTAALLRASCEIGTLCAYLPEEYVQALRQYGESFGMAFQIIDDILDLVSTTELMGKPVGNDLREGVYTLPVIFALGAPDSYRLHQELGQAIDQHQLPELLALITSHDAVSRALDMARYYNEDAAAALIPLPSNPVIDGLARLPAAYLDWALSERVLSTTRDILLN